MPLQIEKFKETIENEDQLNIYSEFHTIMRSIVELSKEYKKLKTKESIEKARDICVELRNELEVLYEKLKDMNKEEIIKDVERIATIADNFEVFLNS